ncbi:MAG: hypothetical protein ACO3XO_04375 [Bdellovibrionota bacterium]
MGKFVFFLVTLSFAAFVVLLFQPGDFLFSGLRLDPRNMLGPSLPDEFEIEQAIQSDEGDILIGIDRRNELRVHLVQARSQDGQATDRQITGEILSNESPEAVSKEAVTTTVESGTSGESSITAGSTKELLEQSKRYKAGEQKDGSFLTRYLSAQIDPRRVVFQSEQPVKFIRTPVEQLAVPSSTDLVMITSKKHHWFGVAYLKEAHLLVLVSHPSEEIQSTTFIQSLIHLGFEL